MILTCAVKLQKQISNDYSDYFFRHERNFSLLQLGPRRLSVLCAVGPNDLLLLHGGCHHLEKERHLSGSGCLPQGPSTDRDAEREKKGMKDR